MMQSISRIGEPHLKHERAHCNRSFARLVFSLRAEFFPFFGTLEFAGRSQDSDAVCYCARVTGRAGVMSMRRKSIRFAIPLKKAMQTLVLKLSDKKQSCDVANDKQALVTFIHPFRCQASI